MGTQIGSIIETREISIQDLTNKSLAVDSFNLLYQFLTTIRQRDGTPLTDSKGNVTSHISGLFFRVTKLMKEKVKLAFVFDGKAPKLKQEERERRKEIKMDAQRKYELAVEKGDIELMRKYASRTARLTPEMVDEAKELISALGLPIIQAPSEGEAQAAYMAKKGEVYALLSQDQDGLMFGSPLIVKNLSITGRKKKTGTSIYQSVNPELIDLADNLNKLGIDNDQLIVLGMLCGTDFNISGIKGIGPKKGLKLVKEYGKDFEKLFKDVKWDDFFDYPWTDVYDTIKNMPTTDDYELRWGIPNKEKISSMMVDKYEFSKERVDKVLDDISKTQAQKGLSEFF